MEKFIIRLSELLVSYFYFLYFIFNENYISRSDIVSLKKIGGGGSDSYLIEGKYLIKLSNPLRDRLASERYLYPHHYWGKLSIGGKDKFKREYKSLLKLAKKNLAPRPIRYGGYFIVISFINKIDIIKWLCSKPGRWSVLIEKIYEMHDQDIFHGDLNLGNIIVDTEDNLYFIDFETYFDFGLSRDEKILIDFIIFIEKLYRFYPDLANEYSYLILHEIHKRDSKFIINAVTYEKWLPDNFKKLIAKFCLQQA